MVQYLYLINEDRYLTAEQVPTADAVPSRLCFVLTFLSSLETSVTHAAFLPIGMYILFNSGGWEDRIDPAVL
jgi:hypothetical protein